MWRELLVAVLLTASNVVIHAVGTYALLRWLFRFARKPTTAVFTRAAWTIVCLITALIIFHALEVVTWAHFYIWQHCFPDRETAYYYSLMSYTTVGYGDVVIASPWRLMGGMEAMAGVLLFGWSTACLVSFVYFVQNKLMEKHLEQVAT
jgi:hypothetical protein